MKTPRSRYPKTSWEYDLYVNARKVARVYDVPMMLMSYPTRIPRKLKKHFKKNRIVHMCTGLGGRK